MLEGGGVIWRNSRQNFGSKSQIFEVVRPVCWDGVPLKGGEKCSPYAKLHVDNLEHSFQGGEATPILQNFELTYLTNLKIT